MSYLSLNDKSCKLPDDGVSWYNLETNRRITVMTGKVGLTYPPVAASNFAIIAEFIDINAIGPNEIKYMRPEHEEELRDEICKRKVSNAKPINAVDICDVSDETINSLSMFSLRRIFVKARIINIVDGDTVDAVMIISPKQFCVSQWGRQNKEMVCTNLALPCGTSPSSKSSTKNQSKTSQSGILIKLRLRLFGIDTAEKNTIPGQRCKEWMELKCAELNNIVYVKLMGPDVCERTLAILYESEFSKRSINQMLVDHVDPFYGKLCVVYFGDHKDEGFTSKAKKVVRDRNEKPVFLEPFEKYDQFSCRIDDWAIGNKPFNGKHEDTDSQFEITKNSRNKSEDKSEDKLKDKSKQDSNKNSNSKHKSDGKNKSKEKRGRSLRVGNKSNSSEEESGFECVIS